MGPVDPIVSPKWDVSLLSSRVGSYCIGDPGLWESQGVLMHLWIGRTLECLRNIGESLVVPAQHLPKFFAF